MYVVRVRPDRGAVEEGVLVIIRRAVMRVAQAGEPILPLSKRLQHCDGDLDIDDGFRGDSGNARGTDMIDAEGQTVTRTPTRFSVRRGPSRGRKG